MSKIFKFGEEVEGYTIPVLNEREIRAAAGMLFLMMFISIQHVTYTHDFSWLKYSVVVFLTDILIRVLINPKFAPSLILGRLIVRNQTPEYVGAKQKLFAWIIGVTLAGTMFVLLNIMNTYSIITALICLFCLIFLFCESAFGICIGCKIYALIYGKKAQYCPGEVCDIKSRQAIQKTSWLQIGIVVFFFVYIFFAAKLLKPTYSEQPKALFGKGETEQTK